MIRLSVALPVLAAALATMPVVAAEPFVFDDVTAETGLARYLEEAPGKKPWRYAHGAGWGDVDGDGRPELYLGAFAARKWFEGDDAPLPNLLLMNHGDRFTLADDPTLQFPKRDARCAGVLFADLDNDGDLDLLVANHVTTANHQGSKLFENQGSGRFRDVTPTNDAWPGRIGMRNASVVDLNDDGLLDLILADGSYGRQAKVKNRLVVLENQGRFQFADAGVKYGFPPDHTLGLGLGIGDVNQDHRPDVFVAGSNRLFVSDGRGKYREAHPGRFSAPPADVREGMHCGAVFGDLNGDDLLDLVTTEHGVPCRVHVYVNRGVKEGLPNLVEVSESVGFGDELPRGTKENPIKATHAAIQDMDNDGRADLFLAIIHKDKQGRVQPVVLRNLASPGGDLKFSKPPFESMVGYYAPAPVADYDRDGRLDMFLASWFENLPSYLMRNVTAGGNWLSVRVVGQGPGLNSMGIGAVVRAYKAGHSGDPEHLVGRYDIAVGTGYASTEEALAHFGLGEQKECDLEVTWGDRKVRQAGVASNRAVTITFAPPAK